MAELYRHKCKCGRKFYNESKRAYLCPYCKGENKKENQQRNKEACKEPIAEVPKPVPVNIPLPRMMQLLELYNKNHGTKYSYGQFVSGIHTGKIKIGVVKNE